MCKIPGSISKALRAFEKWSRILATCAGQERQRVMRMEGDCIFTDKEVSKYYVYGITTVTSSISHTSQSFNVTPPSHPTTGIE